MEFEWPATLPWMQFQSTYLSRMLSTPVSSRSVSYAFTADIMTVAKPQARTQDDGINRRRLLHLQSSIRSSLSTLVDKSAPAPNLSRLAAVMGVSIPECFPGEHIYRARAFIDAPNADDSTMLQESLKVMIFHASNGFHLVEDQRWELTMDVLRQSGLMKHSQFDPSLLDDVTVLAFMEKLFQAAVIRVVTLPVDQAAGFDGNSELDVIEWLLSCGYSPDEPVPITTAEDNIVITAIQAAVMSGDVRLLGLLLAKGANPHLTLSRIPRPLRLALDSTRNLSYGLPRSTVVSETTDSEMVSLLVSRGATKDDPAQNSQEPICALALQHGHVDFATELLQLGSNLCMKTKQHVGMVYESSLLSIAAGFCSTRRQSKHTALSIVKHLMDWAASKQSSTAELITPDVFIAAALQGNHEVIRYLGAFSSRVAEVNFLGFNAFHAAAKNGCMVTCRLLLASAAHLRPHRFIYPFYVACAYNNPNVAEMFLSEPGFQDVSRVVVSVGIWMYRRMFGGTGFPIDAPDHDLRKGYVTGLRIALVSGSSSCAHALLKKGAKLHGGEVIWATRYCQNADLLEAVLRAGGNPNEVDYAGNTALSLVLMNTDWKSWESLAKTLTAHGAKLSRSDSTRLILNGHGRAYEEFLTQALPVELQNHAQYQTGSAQSTPIGPSVFEAAILVHDTNIVAHVLDRSNGSNIYSPSCLCAAIQENWEEDPFRLLLSCRPESVSIQDRAVEMTAVGLAAQRPGSENLLSPLCDALSLDSTALLPFCYDKAAGSFVKVDLDKKAPIWHRRDIMQGSPLGWAALSKNSSSFAFLLRRGVQPDWFTWFELAENDLTELASSLQGEGYRIPDIGQFKHARDRPLNVAICKQNLEMVTILLKAGAPVNHCVRHVPSGLTPLQRAVSIGDLDIINILLDAGANVNADPADDAGATALQLAAMHGYLGIARLLLERGASIDASGARVSGRTALEGAAEYGRVDMIKLLLEYGAATTGSVGEGQRMRSIRLAEGMGHFVAARILKRLQE